MDETPRKTKLYNRVAKDFTPKQALMMICRYLEDELLSRIELLENRVKIQDKPSSDITEKTNQEAIEKTKTEKTLPDKKAKSLQSE